MKPRLQAVFLSAFIACLFFIGGCDTGHSIGHNIGNSIGNSVASSADNNAAMKKITLRSHYNASQCAIDKASVILIQNKAELEAVINKSRRTVLSDKPTTLPGINFEENLALLIALGNKSSAGHGIKLNADNASIRDNKLILPVEIITPEKGSMQAQVITSPCMIVSFTKGDYTRVVINEALELQLKRQAVPVK